MEGAVMISDATEADVSGLCDLLEHLFAQEAEFRPDRLLQTAGLTQIIAFPEKGRILVLREDGLPVGMVSLLFATSTALGGTVALLEDMVVLPERRGKGLGSRLLEAAIDLALSLGCRRITLLTDRSNEPAQRFYGRHGFTVSGMVPMRLIPERGRPMIR